MEQYELYHHGILGMKWGVRRTPAQLGHRPKTASEKAKARIKSINKRTGAKIKKIKEEERYKAKVARAQEKADARIEKAKSKYSAKKTKTSAKPKTIEEMTDAEIRAKIERLNLENQLRYAMGTKVSNTPKEQVSSGKSFMKTVGKDVVGPATKAAAKAVIQATLTKAGMKVAEKLMNQTNKATEGAKEAVSKEKNKDKPLTGKVESVKAEKMDDQGSFKSRGPDPVYDAEYTEVRPDTTAIVPIKRKRW